MAKRRRTRVKKPASIAKKIEAVAGGPLKPFQPHVVVRPADGLLEIVLEDVSCHHSWIPGEGADISLMHANDASNRVVGALLPLNGTKKVRLFYENAEGEPMIPPWTKPPVDVPVQDLREFISQYGPDVTVLVTWTHETNSYQFVTVGSDRLYADSAVKLRDVIAEGLGLTKDGPAKEDRRGDHPNVALNPKQLHFLLWTLGRLYAKADMTRNRAFRQYVAKHHDEVHEILGNALEAFEKAPKA